MKVALVDVDGYNFPNFALMKIAAWHRQNGDNVKWYDPLYDRPERIYKSKVFTFTPDTPDYWDGEIFRGGTGYWRYDDLAPEIDAMPPDYSIYPQYDFAIGFLSRGCIRKCPWCVVPHKEGALRKYDDIARIAQGRKKVILMDNNFLANDFDFVKEQLEKSVRLELKIDFNQGLDARLVTPEIAKLLAKCKWTTISGNNAYIRFSCDTQKMIAPLKDAISILRDVGYNGGIFVYVLAIDVAEAHDRIMQICSVDQKIHPFCQPYRDFGGDGQIHDSELKRLARWCNIASVRKSCTFQDYKRGKQ